jgi:putative transcriptional regulator
MHNHVRRLRTGRDLSQGALATALGVSRQTINAIETGRYLPSLPLAFGLARFFGVRVEDVFDPDTGDNRA